MKSARSLRNVVIVVLAIAALATVGLAARAAAEGTPECPADWPGQGYEGPLRAEDYGHIQYQDYHTDAADQRWYIIRSSDSNGYTTIRAYPTSDDADGGYHADSPDQVCYLIVRKPGAETDAAEPDQVVFPREREIQRTRTSTPTAKTTLAPTRTPQVAPHSAPELSSLELDGEAINARDIVRTGLSRSQEVQIILRGQRRRRRPGLPGVGCRGWHRA